MPEAPLLDQTSNELDLRDSNQDTIVFIRVRDQWLHIAITTLLERHGYRVPLVDHGESLVVTDDDYTTGKRVIRLVSDQPSASSEGLKALLESRVGALISKDDPTQLLIAIEAIKRNLIVVPHFLCGTPKVFAPLLSPLQAEVLRCVVNGMSNPKIAEVLSTNIANVKRVVSRLLRLFEVGSRLELAIRAKELGYADNEDG